LFFRGRPSTAQPFRTPGPYRYVRHPLDVGWMTAFWFTPWMTAGHQVFALGTPAYILLPVVHAERDLGPRRPEYATYRSRVPTFIPRLPALRSASAVRIAPAR